MLLAASARLFLPGLMPESWIYRNAQTGILVPFRPKLAAKAAQKTVENCNGMRRLVRCERLRTLLEAAAPGRSPDPKRFHLQLAFGRKQVVANLNLAISLNNAQDRIDR